MTDDTFAGLQKAFDEAGPLNRGATIDDFRAYLPSHHYMFMPSRDLWPAASVNAVLGPQPAVTATGKPILNKDGNPVMITASAWLDQNRPAHQMVWCPGEPALIFDRLAADGGWTEHTGMVCFNLYHPPQIRLGDKDKAGPWLDHMHKLLAADDAAHSIKWFAHRVQFPQIKINHALVWIGDPGIGKDTAIAPLKWAIGSWNFHEVSPTQMSGRFNGFVKSVVLRVNEGRDLGESDRFKFYEHTKGYIAAPPDVLCCDEKNLREQSVFNVMGVIITSNHKTDGIHLPANDRRHHVSWSGLTMGDFTTDYFKRIWAWYEKEGGYGHVAAYLSTLDISDFDPKAPPPKTAAFWEIVGVSQAPEDGELADLIDELGKPDTLTLAKMLTTATGDILTWLLDRKNRRSIPHRLERCGYALVRGPSDGQWKINGKRQTVYAKVSMSPEAREKAARRLTA